MGKFIKYIFFPNLMYARTSVGNLNLNGCLLGVNTDVNGSSGRSVLNDVFNKICKNLFHENRIKGYQRQIRWNGYINRTGVQHVRLPVENHADDLFQRMPFLVNLDGS